MILMRKSEDKEDFTHITSTYGALLFGVPTHGMDVEAMVDMVLEKSSRYTLGLLDKEVGSFFRLDRREAFCQAFDFPDSRIIQFYEMGRSPTVQKVRYTNSQLKLWNHATNMLHC
jgi:hypothetical protein